MRDWSPSGCDPVSRVADPVLFTGDGDAYVTVPDGHHRWRVTVLPAGGVVAGAVAVRPRVPRGDGAPPYIDGVASTIAYAATGGQAEGQWAPGAGRQLHLVATGYTGAGELAVHVETWRDPPW